MSATFSWHVEAVAFDPEILGKMGEAFDQACQSAKSKPDRENIAKCIVELASAGERDPVQLCARTIEMLRLRAA